MRQIIYAFLLSPLMLVCQTDMTNKGGSGLTLFIGDVTVHCDGSFTNAATTGNLEFKGTGSPQLEVNGDCTINSTSTFTKGIGTIVMNGGGSAQLLDGGGKDVYNLTIDNSGSTVSLTSNGIGIDNTLTFTAGHLVLGTQDITLNSSASHSGASSSKFAVAASSGEFIQVDVGAGSKTGAVVFPIGYTNTSSSYCPFEIDNDAGGAATFGVRVDDDVLASGTSGAPYTQYVVDRTWHVSNSAGTANSIIAATWHSAQEMTYYNRVNTYFSKWVSGTTWNQDGGVGSATSLGSSFYKWTNTTATTSTAKPWAIASNSELPVELIEYTAEKEGNQTRLNWITASETDCDYFIIERSPDNENFGHLLNQTGAGTTNEISNYTRYDLQPQLGLNYYRLSQFDFDGDYEVLGTRVVNFESLFSNGYSIYPNPAIDQTYLSITSELPEKYAIQVYDELGKLLKSTEVETVAGENIYEINAGDLAAGQYYIKILGQSKIENIQKLTITK